MFSDKYRLTKIFVLFVLIILFCLYSHINNPEITLRECLANPERFDGQLLSIHRDIKVNMIGEDRFELMQGEDRIVVMGTPENLKVGDSVHASAVFHKEGYLELKRMRSGSRLQTLKIIVSIPPVFLVAWYFFKQYRFDLKKQIFVRKR